MFETENIAPNEAETILRIKNFEMLKPFEEQELFRGREPVVPSWAQIVFGLIDSAISGGVTSVSESLDYTIQLYVVCCTYPETLTNEFFLEKVSETTEIVKGFHRTLAENNPSGKATIKAMWDMYQDFVKLKRKMNNEVEAKKQIDNNCPEALKVDTLFLALKGELNKIKESKKE